MFDGNLMIQVNWPAVDTIHLQSTCNKFVTGVEINVTGDLQLNDSPGVHVLKFQEQILLYCFTTNCIFTAPQDSPL